ncbi:hypothetical protein AB4Y90_08630 [Chryseobacterium sp. 2TAF14]|uniref:hypothetical protein n=1 Tax=Chryseobacterium sp. 2TAF14 TaxID=3233007 RepID=UPI003F9174BD
MTNKEYGSDFHYFNETHTSKTSFFDENFSFFFSGRVALYNLLESGINKYGWKKVGFPSYYCHEVVEYCKKLPIEVEYYSYNPLSDRLPDWDDAIENVFINVDFFGIKKLDTDFLKNSIIIDDLTHNLLSVSKSEAHYCFGSLRKQLPIATGGFVYSKNENFENNIHSNEFANNIALKKLAAMFLKSEYLKGLFSQKDVYRIMFSEAEENFQSYDTNAKLPEIIYTQLSALSPEELISKTYKNIQSIKKLIFPSDKISLLQSSENTEMGLVFICENNDLRNQFKSYLIENKIFPAILWPEQFNISEIDLQNRILFIHADFRYQNTDIEFIANVINKFIENV